MGHNMSSHLFGKWFCRIRRRLRRHKKVFSQLNRPPWPYQTSGIYLRFSSSIEWDHSITGAFILIPLVITGRDVQPHHLWHECTFSERTRMLSILHNASLSSSLAPSLPRSPLRAAQLYRKSVILHPLLSPWQHRGGNPFSAPLSPPPSPLPFFCLAEFAVANRFHVLFFKLKQGRSWCGGLHAAWAFDSSNEAVFWGVFSLLHCRFYSPKCLMSWPCGWAIIQADCLRVLDDSASRALMTSW